LFNFFQHIFQGTVLLLMTGSVINSLQCVCYW